MKHLFKTQANGSAQFDGTQKSQGMAKVLNRIKYILVAVLTGISLCQPCFANDSTISYISINDKVYEDVEIMIGNGSEILVPFKQLADIFEIQYNANRVDKIIGFKTFNGEEGVINLNGIFINDNRISPKKPIFMNQGIMDNVYNEAFIPADVAEKILGIKLVTDYSSLTLEAVVDRDVKILHYGASLEEEYKGPKAHPDVVLPKKNKVISLNKIGLNSNMVNSNMSMERQGYKDINDTISGTTSVTAVGNLLGGKYKFENSAYHYRDDWFTYNGLTATYMNNIKDKYFYELGKVKGITDNDSAIGTNIYGGQIWNYNYDRPTPSKINGYVKPTSIVRVTFNDEEQVDIDTYAGYYSLKNVQIPRNLKTLRIEEVNEDGTVELVKEEKYNQYGNTKPLAQENRGSIYAGVWGYNNRLFRDGDAIYRGNNKKITAGIDYQHGIKDNFTFESKLTGDKIYQKSTAQTIYRLPTNDTLLVTGTQKSTNYIEGITTMNNIDYVSQKNPNLKGRLTAAGSIAHDTREEYTKGGFLVKATGEYNKNLRDYKFGIIKPKSFSAKVEAYDSSPDFYIASSDSTSKNDRIGGRAQGTLSFNSTSVGGGYNKYYSNINHRYQGGTIAFDEFNVNAGTTIPKIATISHSFQQRRGENDLGRNKNYSFDLSASRHFGRWAHLRAGWRQNLYDTKYHDQSSTNRNYSSKYRDIYTDLDIPIPKEKGKFRLGHDFINYDTTGYKNHYNMFRFGYTFPTWKNWTLGLGWGFRYHGQSGNDLNVTMGYRAKSGQMMTVGYQYSRNGGYFIDNMFTPTTCRHSVNFVFNDAFQVFHNGFKSVGNEYNDKGIFEAIAFIDVDKNGKYDKKIDIPMPDIPVVTSWATDAVYTNKKGRVDSAALAEGVYNISLDMDSLPITVAPLTNDLITKTIKIDSGLTTKLELPLASTVGSVSGKLRISDDFDRDLRLTDFVVVLLNKDGEEVNYSTVDETGNFYISGLEPGQYKLQLDEKFIGAYGLEEVENKSYIDIFIPFDYFNPTDITNQELEYKTLAL